MALSQRLKRVYLTCCLHSTAESINAMTEGAREVSYATFIRRCDWRSWGEAMGYDRGGLTLKRDWHVRYFRSRYEGQTCYYAKHSAIEYIFV